MPNPLEPEEDFGEGLFIIRPPRPADFPYLNPLGRPFGIHHPPVPGPEDFGEGLGFMTNVRRQPDTRLAVPGVAETVARAQARFRARLPVAEDFSIRTNATRLRVVNGPQAQTQIAPLGAMPPLPYNPLEGDTYLLEVDRQAMRQALIDADRLTTESIQSLENFPSTAGPSIMPSVRQAFLPIRRKGEPGGEYRVRTGYTEAVRGPAFFDFLAEAGRRPGALKDWHDEVSGADLTAIPGTPGSRRVRPPINRNPLAGEPHPPLWQRVARAETGPRALAARAELELRAAGMTIREARDYMRTLRGPLPPSNPFSPPTPPPAPTPAAPIDYVAQAEELIARARAGELPSQAVFDRLRQIEFRVQGLQSDNLVERLLRAQEAAGTFAQPGAVRFNPLGPEPPRLRVAQLAGPRPIAGSTLPAVTVPRPIPAVMPRTLHEADIVDFTFAELSQMAPNPLNRHPAYRGQPGRTLGAGIASASLAAGDVALATTRFAGRQALRFGPAAALIGADLALQEVAPAAVTPFRAGVDLVALGSGTAGMSALGFFGLFRLLQQNFPPPRPSPPRTRSYEQMQRLEFVEENPDVEITFEDLTQRIRLRDAARSQLIDYSLSLAYTLMNVEATNPLPFPLFAEPQPLPTGAGYQSFADELLADLPADNPLPSPMPMPSAARVTAGNPLHRSQGRVGRITTVRPARNPLGLDVTPVRAPSRCVRRSCGSCPCPTSQPPSQVPPASPPSPPPD